MITKIIKKGRYMMAFANLTKIKAYKIKINDIIYVVLNANLNKNTKMQFIKKLLTDNKSITIIK